MCGSDVKEKALVSVVVPVYKVEKYLPECITSIVSQTYKNMEIILIDDGSPDQCGKICDEYAKKDSRIQVIHKKNEGVSIARNTGIEHASGKYILFVDADDYISLDLVESVMKATDEETTIIWDHTSDMKKWQSVFQDQKMIPTEYIHREEFMKLFFRDYVNPPVNKLFKTNIIKQQKIRFPEEKNLGEDLSFNLTYFQNAGGDYKILHVPYYFYRENREGSLSNPKRRNLLQVQKDIFGEIMDFLQRTDIWTEENAEIYYGMYWDRLFLTWKYMKRLNLDILNDPIWDYVWNECCKRGLCGWKRKMKKWIIGLEKIKSDFR